MNQKVVSSTQVRSRFPEELLPVVDELRDGDVIRAESACRAFMLKNPQNVHGMRLLAHIGVKQNVLDDAEFLLESCLAFAPGYIEARFEYAKVLRKRQKFQKAYQQAQELIRADPYKLEFRSMFATASVAVGDFDTALGIYNDLIAASPSANLYLFKGHALKTIGRLEEAIASYRYAGRIKPDFGDVFWSLANLKTFQFEQAEIDHMRVYEAAPNTALVDRYHFCFALGKAFEDQQIFDRSFEYYERGNRLKKSEIRYDSSFTDTECRTQESILDAALFSRKSKQGFPAPDPIFIVGLPRAGSTLLEQILASHALVDGTLELPHIFGLAHKLKGWQPLKTQRRYPKILHDLSAEQLTQLGKKYIDETRLFRNGAPYFTDKMPNNFRHIGLIHLILPNAKIIDARRNPMACCFSGFKQLFAEGQEFSYDLDDIARYYQNYVSLMDHWARVLPGKILRVNYEDVVGNLESEVRRILEFCGLPFDEKCLEFHRTDRAVRTASSEQVRQPLYKSGIEQWKNYEPFLQSLKQALGIL